MQLQCDVIPVWWGGDQSRQDHVRGWRFWSRAGYSWRKYRAVDTTEDRRGGDTEQTDCRKSTSQSMRLRVILTGTEIARGLGFVETKGIAAREAERWRGITSVLASKASPEVAHRSRTSRSCDAESEHLQGSGWKPGAALCQILYAMPAQQATY